MISEHDVIIKAVTVRPFTWNTTCPACGLDSSGWMTHIKRWFYGRCHPNINVAFCQGGKEPTEEVEDHNPTTLVIGPEGPMFGGPKQIRHKCAGIEEPHLHVKCRQCDCAWLMATMR